MKDLLDNYRKVVGDQPIYELTQLAVLLKGVKVLHINSTKTGGGVAEILMSMTQLMAALGIETQWEILKGTPDFFECTKLFHNSIQGLKNSIPNSHLLKTYEQVNRDNVEYLQPLLDQADVVFIHDPQPAALINFFPNRKNKWVWRCHIDAANPQRDVWKFLRQFVYKYDASVFSLADFVQTLPHPIHLIPPSIDPLSAKNQELSSEEMRTIYSQFPLDPDRPFVLQVSRFDYFKDPLGVIKAYQLTKKYKPDLQLVLAGGGALDDPEGEAVLKEVQIAAKNDSDIHILYLPSDSHTTINALQSHAEIVLQKSIKEGFGLTVSEALWKKKPVIGGNSGGIRLQVINNQTGYLVDTPEGASERMRYLLQNSERKREMGEKGRRLVHENFLITRHLRDYLALMVSLLQPGDKSQI